MNPQPALDAMTLIFTFAVGVWMLASGLWPRRIGTTPYCRRCDYNLTGLESDRCPECGTELTSQTIVHGQRHRRKGSIIAASLIIAVPLALAFVPLRNFNWYRLMPTAWVLRDIQSADPPTANKGWREMQRRINNDTLSAGQRSKLIDVGLQMQRNAPAAAVTQNLINYLGQAFLDGHLTQARIDPFFKQMTDWTLEVRKQVVSPDHVPYRVDFQCRVPGQPYWIRTKHGEIKLDGRTTRHGGSSSSTSSSGGGGGSGSMISSIPCNEPGTHTLSVTVVRQIFAGPFGDEAASQFCYEDKRVLEKEFEVLATEPDDYFTLIEDATIADRVHGALFPQNLTLRRNKPRAGDHTIQFTLYGTIKIETVPINIAFDVFARVGDREYTLGSIHRLKGDSTNYRFGSPCQAPPFTTCDVILRSSEKTARNTVDLYEIWKGELVYENVTVEVETPTSRAATVRERRTTQPIRTDP